MLASPNLTNLFDKSHKGIALFKPNAECVYINGPLKSLLMTREDPQIIAQTENLWRLKVANKTELVEVLGKKERILNCQAISLD